MGTKINTEEDCTVNNTYYVSSYEDGFSYNVLFSDFQETSTKFILPTILSFGLIGNIGFLITVFRVRSMRTTTNFYLSNLAVADLMFLSMAIGTRLQMYVTYGIPNNVPLLGQVGCILYRFWVYIFSFASLILITFVSFERFVAVCHPLRHRLISGRSRSMKLIVVCWLMALFSTPLVIPSSSQFKHYCLSWNTDDPRLHDKFPGIIGRCESMEGSWAMQMLYLVQTLPFFVAFFGNFFFYTRILLKLHQRDSYNRQRRIHTRNQVAVMLIANGTVFLLTMTSFHVTSLLLFVETFLDYKLIPTKTTLRHNLFEANRILFYINSAVNPLVYTLTNARYRQAFRRAFTSCKSSRRQRSSTINSVQAPDLNQVNQNQTPATTENVTVTQAQYLNICFKNDDRDPIAKSSEHVAMTVFD